MAKKEDIRLDQDDDLDLDFDDFDIEDGFTDGSENKKDRKPTEAIRAGIKDGIKENFSLDGVEAAVDRAMPKKFSVGKDELKDYVREGKKLFDDSYGEVSRSVSQSRERMRKAAAVYERAGMPRPLVELLKKIGGRAEEREEELRRKTEEQENQEEIAGALDDLAKAQLEMQKNAQARDMIREEMEGKRFESQQELLFGIRGNLQRSNDYREQVATRFYNNQIKISFQQLHTQRSLLRSVLQSAEHQKAALDSIVKNTALPDIVKQHQSELMKDIFQRRLGNFVSSKFGDYAKNFKENFIGNVTNSVKGAVSGFTGALDGITGGIEMHADALSSMIEMEEMMGGKKEHRSAERAGKLFGSQVNKILFNRIFGALGKTDRAGALAEKFSRTVSNIPALANRFKDEKGNSANFLARTLAGFLPGYNEKGLTHNLNSEGKLKERAEFDNKTRSSIIDVIPALLSKIHQSTEAIRMGVANHIKVNDGDLLEWDATTNSLSARKTIDAKMMERIQAVANNDKQIKIANGIINLIDPPSEKGRTKIPKKIRDKFAEAIIKHSAKGQGFLLKDFLNPKSPVYTGMNEKDIEKIIVMVTKNLSYDGIGNGLSRTEVERNITSVNAGMMNIANYRGYTHDVLANLSSISGTDQARLARLRLGKQGIYGDFTTDDSIVDDESIRAKLIRKMGRKELLNQKLTIDRDGLDVSIDTFKSQPGYEPDPNGGLGTVSNPSTEYLKGEDGKPKPRLNYEEWIEYRRSFEGSARENIGKKIRYFNEKILGNTVGKLKGPMGPHPKNNLASKIANGVSYGFRLMKTTGGIGSDYISDKFGKINSTIGNTIESILSNLEWKMPKNIVGGYDWIKIEEYITKGTNSQAYMLVWNKREELKNQGIKEEDIDAHIDIWLREKTNRTDPGITLSDVKNITKTIKDKKIKISEDLKNTYNNLKEKDFDEVLDSIASGTKKAAKKARKQGKKFKDAISKENGLKVQNLIKETAGIDIPLNDIISLTGQEVTGIVKAVKEGDITQSGILMDIATGTTQLHHTLQDSGLGRLATDVKEKYDERVRRADDEKRKIREETQDVYVKGEYEPRLLGKKLAAGKYVLLHGGKTIYNINDITGPVIDRDTRDIRISTDDYNLGLVTEKGEEIKTKPKGNDVLSRISRMDSWTMTKAVVKFMMKPIKTMDVTDAYLPSEDGSPPRHVISKYKMLMNWYQDKDGKIIKRIQDITGDVYDKFRDKVLDAEDIPKLVDTRGRPLSKSYFIRRARLAKDMLSPLVKLHTKPISWLMKKLITNPLKNRLGDAGNTIKGKMGGLLSLLPFAKRKGLAEDELSAQDANTKAREEAIAKRNAEAEARRNKKGNEGGLFAPLINFLKGSFKKLLLIGGPLFMLFKDGIGAGLNKMWDIGKWMIDNFGGHIWDAVKWLGGPILAWMGMKAAGKWAAGKVWDRITDSFSGDIDIDRKGKGPKGKKGLFKSVTEGVKNTINSGKDALKNRTAKKTIEKTAMSQQKYTLAQQAAKKTTAKAVEKGMTTAGQKTVAKQAAKQATKVLATQAAKKVGMKAVVTGAGLLLAGTAAAPLLAIAAGLWTAYEIGSWVYEYFKSSPNSVDKFRIAAYGFNPENEYRANNVLKLEKYMVEVTKFKEDGSIEVPDIDWSVKGKAGDVMMGFLGGDEGRKIYANMSDEEKLNFATGYENWYTNRFLPVYQQHAISLNQIDNKLKLHEAFDRVGSNTIKFGLVPSWLKRAYFDKPDNNPYNVMEDPFLYSETDESGKDPLASINDIKFYYDDVMKRYKGDEADLRKSEENRAKYAASIGKSHEGLFDFEKTTTKYDPTKPVTQTTTSSVSTVTNEEAVKRIAYNKDGSFSETSIIGNNIYLLSDVAKVDTKGQSVIDDGVAIRMRLYGLTHLVDSKVNALLTLEKLVTPYLKIEGNGFASFTKFELDKLLATVAPSLGWSKDAYDIATLKNWFIHRFSAVFLAYASLINQYTSSKDIFNAEQKMKPENKHDVYVQLSMLKGVYNGKELPIWELAYTPIKNLEVNKDSGSILVNLKNLENDRKLVLLTERETTDKPIPTKTLEEFTDNYERKHDYDTALTESIMKGAAEGKLNGGTAYSGNGYYKEGGSISKYSSKDATPDKKAIAKALFEEMDKMGWSETEKNHFLAQITHETGGLKWLRELGNEAYFAKKKYGSMWRGRGVIQLTWKENYQKFADWAGRPDIMQNPDLVATDPVLAVKSGIYWWENRKKQSKLFAEAVTREDSVKTVSKFVNGGYNGLNDRIHQFKEYSSGKGVLREMAGIVGKASEGTQTAKDTPPTNEVASGNTTASEGVSKPVTHDDIYKEMGVGQNESKPNESSYSGSGGFQQQGERSNHTSTPGQVKAVYATEGLDKTNVLGGGSKLSEALAKATPELVELGKKSLQPLNSNVVLDGMKPNFMKLLYAAAGKYAQQGGQLAGITSAFRTEAEQERLRQQNPGNAAKGRSRHQDGIAIDLNNNKIKDTKSGPVDKFFASGIPEEFGFKRNLLYRKDGSVWEPWHLENSLVGKAGGNGEPEASLTNEVSGKPTTVLEQSANNGTYNTGSTNTSLPQVSENTYSGVHAQGGYTSSNPNNPLGEAWGQVFNSEGNIGKTEQTQNRGMQAQFDKQGAQLDAQQSALLEQQKQLSDNMTNVLKEQLTVQKESKDLLSKLVEYLMEGKKIAGTNVSDPNHDVGLGVGGNNSSSSISSSPKIGKQTRPAVNMAIGNQVI